MKKTKYIFVIMLCALFITACSTGVHKNTTGIGGYKDSDITFNCTYNETTDKGEMETYIDFLFNVDNYQMKQYSKIVLKYYNGVTDEDYKKIVDDANSLECVTNTCTDPHLELGITDYGWDTVIDRYSDRVEIKYHSISGMGQKATKNDIKDTKKQLEGSGFTCN